MNATIATAVPRTVVIGTNAIAPAAAVFAENRGGFGE